MNQRYLDTNHVIVTPESLQAEGFDSFEDMLRDEYPQAGIYTPNTLNLGLNDKGRAIFRESALKAIQHLYPDMRRDNPKN